MVLACYFGLRRLLSYKYVLLSTSSFLSYCFLSQSSNCSWEDTGEETTSWATSRATENRPSSALVQEISRLGGKKVKQNLAGTAKWLISTIKSGLFGSM
jgi:hypothetical protein